MGLSPVIIRNKSKHSDYYPVFSEYQHTKNPGNAVKMIKLLEVSVSESLHKRLAYLESKEIVGLARFARREGLSLQSSLAKAKRQTIPAFREGGVWKIARQEL